MVDAGWKRAVGVEFRKDDLIYNRTLKAKDFPGLVSYAV